MMSLWTAILGWIAKTSGGKVLVWLADHRKEMVVALLLLALSWSNLRVRYWRSKAESFSQYERKVVEQSHAVEEWKETAEKARAQAQLARLAAEAGYRREKQLVGKILARDKDPITCEDSWSRLMESLEGTQWR